LFASISLQVGERQKTGLSKEFKQHDYIGKSGRYPNQDGFGWTNAVFVKLVNEFCSK